MAEPRWGIKFQVNTQALRTLSNSSRYMERVAGAISRVKDSIEDSVKSMGTVLKDQVQALNESVRSLEASAARADAQMGSAGRGGGYASKRHFVTPDRDGSQRLQSYWMNKLGISEDAYKRYKAEGRDKNSRSAPGGIMVGPKKDEAGNSYYTARQMQVNTLKLVVVDPIVRAMNANFRRLRRTNTASGFDDMDRDIRDPNKMGLRARTAVSNLDRVVPAIMQLVQSNHVAGAPPTGDLATKIINANKKLVAAQVAPKQFAALNSNWSNEGSRAKAISDQLSGITVPAEARKGIISYITRSVDAAEASLKVYAVQQADTGRSLKRFIKNKPAGMTANTDQFGETIANVIGDDFVTKVMSAVASASVGQDLGRSMALVHKTAATIPDRTYKLQTQQENTGKRYDAKVADIRSGVAVEASFPFFAPMMGKRGRTLAAGDSGALDGESTNRQSASVVLMSDPKMLPKLAKSISEVWGGDKSKIKQVLADPTNENISNAFYRAISNAEKALREWKNLGPKPEMKAESVFHTESGQVLQKHLSKLGIASPSGIEDMLGDDESYGVTKLQGLLSTFRAAHYLKKNPFNKEHERSDLYDFSDKVAKTAATSDDRSMYPQAFLSTMGQQLIMEGYAKGKIGVGPGQHRPDEYLSKDESAYGAMRAAYVHATGDEPDPKRYRVALKEGSNQYVSQISEKSIRQLQEAITAALSNSIPNLVKDADHGSYGSDGRIFGRYVDDHAEQAFGLRKNPGTHWGDRLRTATGKMATYAAGGSLLFGGASAISSGFREMAEYEKALVDIKRVLNPLGADMKAVSAEAHRMGMEYGVAATEVAKGMLVFAQQGQSMQDILKNTEAAVLATNVTELNLVEATEALTAAQRQFAMGSNQSMNVLDSWNEVENTTAVNTRVLTEALKRAGTAARVSGIDFHMFNGIAAAMGEATRKSGDTIGTAMKFILQNSRSDKAVMSLQEVGIATEDADGNMKSAKNTLGELAQKWDKLTDSQKHNVATNISGTRHLNDFFVMMETWDRAIDISITSLMSQGSAQRENAISMESLNKKVQSLRSSYDSLWQTIGESGALDVLKQMVDLTNQLVKITSGAANMGGGTLGTLLGIGGVAGIGAGAAGWGLGGILPQFMMGGIRQGPAGLTDRQKANIYAKEKNDGVNGRGLGSELFQTNQEGYNPGPYWTRNRMQGLGMIVGGQGIKALYDNNLRDTSPSHVPNLADTSIDMGSTALTTAGMMKMLKTARGGWMNKLVLGAVAAGGVSQMYKQGKDYFGRTPGQMSEDTLKNLRYSEDKFASTRSDLQGYMRSIGSGESGGDVDLQRALQLKDTMAALIPGMTKFDQAGNVLVDDVQGWIKDLDKSLSDIRNQRTQAIKARLFAELNSDETKTNRAALQKAIAQRSQMGNASVADRMANLGVIEKLQAKDDSAILNPFRAEALSEGQNRGAFQPYSREELSKLGGSRYSADEMAIVRLSESVAGRTGMSVNVRDQMKDQGISDALMMKYVQLEKSGPLYDASTGRATAFDEKEVRARGEGIVKGYDSKFGDAVVITPDANLNRLVSTLNASLERLIGKNQDLIKATETMSMSIGLGTVGQNPAASPFGQTAIKQLQLVLDSISTIDKDGVKNFNTPPITGTTNIGFEMKQLIAEIDRLGKEKGIGLQGLVNAGTLSMDRTFTMRQRSEKWLNKLIEVGGDIAKVPTAKGDGTDEDTAVQNRYYKGLVDNAGPETAAQLDFMARQIKEIEGKPKTADTVEQIDRIKGSMKGLLESAMNVHPELFQKHTNDEINNMLAYRQQAMAGSVQLMGDRYNYERRTGVVSGMGEFMSQPENTKVFTSLKDQVSALAQAMNTQKDALAEATNKGDKAGIDVAQQRLNILTIAFDNAKNLLDGFNGAVQNSVFGLKEQEKATQRFINSVESGISSKGFTGLNADSEAIKDLWKELQELNRNIADLNKQPASRDRDNEVASLRARGARISDEIEKASERAKDEAGRRTDIVNNLPQRLLASRIGMLAGIGSNGAGNDFREVLRKGFGEFTQNLAKDLLPALQGKSPAEREGILRQLQQAMGPLVARFREADLNNDPQYKRTYLTASPGDRATADYIKQLMGQGMSANEIFSDPMLRDAAQNNPLISQLMDKMMEGEGEQENLRLQGMILDENKTTAEATSRIAKLMEEMTGKPQKYGNPFLPSPDAGSVPTKAVPTPDFTYALPKPPGMAVGSQALAGTAAVDGSGRIRKDGTPAVLHEGEIVLTKEQSAAFLQNHYADGTLPSGKVPKLPDDLAGAKPRYGYGRKSFELDFATDIEKALYITAQQGKKSKRDADYIKFLKDAGLTDQMITDGGVAIRDFIKGSAKVGKDGDTLVVGRMSDGFGTKAAPPQPVDTPEDKAIDEAVKQRKDARTAELEAQAAKRAEYDSKLPSEKAGIKDEVDAALSDYDNRMAEEKAKAEAVRTQRELARQAKRDAIKRLAEAGEAGTTAKVTPEVAEQVAQAEKLTEQAKSVGMTRDEALAMLPENVRNAAKKAAAKWTTLFAGNDLLPLNEFGEGKLNSMMEASTPIFKEMAGTLGFNEAQASLWHDLSNFMVDPKGESSSRLGEFRFAKQFTVGKTDDRFWTPNSEYSARLNRVAASTDGMGHESEIARSLAATKIHEGGHAFDLPWADEMRGGLKSGALKDSNNELTRRLWTAVLSDRNKIGVEVNRGVLARYANRFEGFLKGDANWYTSHKGQEVLSELIRGRVERYAIEGRDAPKYLQNLHGNWLNQLDRMQPVFAGKRTVVEATDAFLKSDRDTSNLLKKMGFNEMGANPKLNDFMYGIVGKRQGMFPTFKKIGDIFKGKNPLAALKGMFGGKGDMSTLESLFGSKLPKGPKVALEEAGTLGGGLKKMGAGAMKMLGRAVDGTYNGIAGGIRSLFDGTAAKGFGNLMTRGAVGLDKWVGKAAWNLGGRPMTAMMDPQFWKGGQVSWGTQADLVEAAGGPAKGGWFRDRWTGEAFVDHKLNGDNAHSFVQQWMDSVHGGGIADEADVAKQAEKMAEQIRQAKGWGNRLRRGVNPMNWGGYAKNGFKAAGKGMDALHYLSESRLVGALSHAGTFGLMAADLGGEWLTRKIGGDNAAEAWKQNVAPAVSGLFTTDMAANAARGKGLLGFGKEAQFIARGGTEVTREAGLGTRFINGVGNTIEGTGAKLAERRFLGTAGKALEYAGTGTRWGARALGGTAKLAGKLAEPVLIADTSIDVARLANWGMYQTGLRDKHSYTEGSKTLGSMSEALWTLPMNGIESTWNWAHGNGFTNDSWKQMDRGQNLLAEGERNLFKKGGKPTLSAGDQIVPTIFTAGLFQAGRAADWMTGGEAGIWFDQHIIARDIAKDLAQAEVKMNLAQKKYLDEQALNTPLAIWGSSELAKMAGGGAGSGMSRDQMYSKQLDAMKAKLKDEDETLSQYRSVTGNDKERTDDQKQQLQQMMDSRDLLQQRIAFIEKLRDTKDDYRGVADIGRATANLNNEKVGDAMGAGEWAQKIAALAATPDGEAGLRAAMGEGAYRAFKWKHPEASEEQAQKWRQVGSLMDLDAKLGDIIGYRVENPFDVNHELVGTDKKGSDFVLDSTDGKDTSNSEGSANFWMAKLKGNKDARKRMDDSTSFNKAAGLIESNKQFDELTQYLSQAGYSQYTQQSEGLKGEYELALQQLGYKYTTGADPEELTAKLKLWSQFKSQLDPHYDVTSSNYKNLMDAAAQASSMWFKLDANIQKKKLAGTSSNYQPKAGEFDVWSFVGMQAPAPLTDVALLRNRFGDWAKQAEADKAGWTKAAQAKAMADDANAKLVQQSKIPSIEYKLQKTTEGSKIVGRGMGESTFRSSTLGDLEKQVQEQRKKFWERQSNGTSTVDALRVDVMGGASKSQEDFNSRLQNMDPALAEAVANYNALNNQIKGVQGGTAEGDAAKSEIERQRAEMLANSPYTQKTLDSVNRMAEMLDRQQKAEAHRKEVIENIKAQQAYQPTQADLDAQNAQKGIVVDDSQPVRNAFYTGTSHQAGTDAVDLSGRIRKVLDAKLHPGEMVLRADHADAFEQMLQQNEGYSFMTGTLPAKYDSLSVDAAQYNGSSEQATSSKVQHSGEITLNAGDDLMSLFRKVMQMMEQQQGNNGGPSFKAGDPMNPGYMQS